MSAPTPLARIEGRILLIRGQKVMVDADLAELYGVPTKRLNEQVKRNQERFPSDFMFQLTAAEKAEVVANCDHLGKLKFSKSLPHAFTEHGAIQAANVLASPQAIEVGVYVVRAFVHSPFTAVYDDIVREGEQLHPVILKPNGKPGKQSEAHNLLHRFQLHTDAILRFISNPAVPFSNNIAKRAVRMPKVKQKISGCFRTVTCANNFCTISFSLDTLRKQGHSMLEVLRRAFIGDPIMPAV